MQTPLDNTRCVTCERYMATYRCEGCLRQYCLNHLNEHVYELGQKLNETENRRDSFLELLNQQRNDPEKNDHVQQINQWESESIKKIKVTANEARQLLIKHLNGHINDSTAKLKDITERIQQFRKQNNFNENHIKKLDEELKILESKFHKFPHISIHKEASSFIEKISVQNYRHKWVENGITIAGGNGRGNALNQLSQSWAIDIDENQSLYISDSENHRIMKWKNGVRTGEIVVGKFQKRSQNDQLKEPKSIIVDKQNQWLYIADSGNRRVLRWSCENDKTGEIIISNINCWGLAMDDTGYLYTSNIDEHEIRRWKIGENNGMLIAGGKGQGDRVDQLNNPYFIFVDHDRSVYVSDYGNHRVMKWMKGAKQGIVVAIGHDQLLHPFGIFVDRLGTLYVADHNNHRIMRYWSDHDHNSDIPILSVRAPYDLTFDRENNLYILDYDNQRVQKFNICFS